MAVEGHFTALFNTLALPPIHESYRNIVFQQLYANFDPVFQSVCWASGEQDKGPERHSGTVMLPGEERFLVERHDTRFSHADRYAIHCQHHKEETSVKVKQEDGTVKVQTAHYCRLAPSSRPIMCRVQPFRIARDPLDNRSVVVMCDMSGPNRSVLARMGQRRIDQIVHDIVQMAISMWAFLTDAWWTYYEASFPVSKQFRTVVKAKFSLTDDVVISNIKNAQPAWRAEILAQMATPECPACTGSGIEFMDATLDGIMLPVLKRRFDICRTCIMPVLGMRLGGTLIDPVAGKVLTADGTEYRGDTIIKKDR